jgi:hypothetical protein
MDKKLNEDVEMLTFSYASKKVVNDQEQKEKNSLKLECSPEDECNPETCYPSNYPDECDPYTCGPRLRPCNPREDDDEMEEFEQKPDSDAEVKKPMRP